ncbi:MAG: Multidrug resistance protein MdtA [Burkholderiaceae bacterium]|nr:Multidrug resistance protein MdtA [Burkholderiaceae bacterium]
MLHRLVAPLIAAVLVAACSRGAAPDPAGAAATLLLAPEDMRTLAYRERAEGPVVTGSVQPERRADLRAEVSSVVLQVLKDNGEPVRKGDLLVRLDDTAIRDSLASADEAVRASAQAFEQAERQVQRLKTLQAQGMTSMQALEDAEVRRNGVQSDLVATRARQASARQTLQRTEVRAPFDGVVSDRKVSAGDTAQVGKELLKVIDPRTMRFEGLVSADRMGELRLGQPVRFRVNGYGATDFMGTLARIDASANATTRQVEVVIVFGSGERPHVAGLYAEGRIETGTAQVLMVPEGSVVRSADTTHVWRVNGTALQKVAVRLGERDPRLGEFPVLAGLAAGDRILRAPGSTLVDGQKVEFAAAASSGRAPLTAKR